MNFRLVFRDVPCFGGMLVDIRVSKVSTIPSLEVMECG